MLVPAMVFLFVFGLVAITILAGVMKSGLGFNEGQILAFTLLSFLTMLGLEGVFIALLFRRPRHNDEGEPVKLKDPATNQLDAARAPALPDAAPSVTEHTTRAFNPVYSDRK
jgi:membrane protein implicated in regulation of membrane protease activity